MNQSREQIPCSPLKYLVRDERNPMTHFIPSVASRALEESLMSRQRFLAEGVRFTMRGYRPS